ncbi:MAG: HIT domain-containing protein [Actinobacteria bacterium]|nr:HIT domain-containing protein [Actinomycetota bacterium]MCL6087353.1 HIT domain-containing protein [Actinomycetota bacterium]
MPEFRRDIILDEWVIIATERAKRPEMFIEEKVKIEKPSGMICPFDKGNESMTPPEILRMDKNGAIINYTNPDWQIRVVPNKFPALKPFAAPGSVLHGIYNVMDGFGLHEVIINSSEHILNLSQLSEYQLSLIADVYIRRLKEIKKDSRIESVIIMLNQGRDAGASIEHSHSQIFALPFNSPVLEKELRGTLKYYRKYKRCAVCDILSFELKENLRIIFENQYFVIMQPFASRNPFETWIIPKSHHPNFENIKEDIIPAFAQCLKIIVDFFYNDLGNPSFNYYIHTGPLHTKTDHHYHWHFELVPKLSIKAGFEIATGIDICVATPEDTAKFMKEKITKIH